jgi:hypothetical protein
MNGRCIGAYLWYFVQIIIKLSSSSSCTVTVHKQEVHWCLFIVLHTNNNKVVVVVVITILFQKNKPEADFQLAFLT